MGRPGAHTYMLTLRMYACKAGYPRRLEVRRLGERCPRCNAQQFQNVACSQSSEVRAQPDQTRGTARGLHWNSVTSSGRDSLQKMESTVGSAAVCGGLVKARVSVRLAPLRRDEQRLLHGSTK